MTTPQLDLPKVSQKVIGTTANSAYKAIMGLALQGLQSQFAMNQWNIHRFQKLMANHNTTNNQISPQDIQTTPISEDKSDVQTMRVDSDNIQYNMYTVTAPDEPPKSNNPITAVSPLLSLGKTALLATGIGVPASIGLTMLPEIIKALKPQSVEAPAFDPDNFDLFVGKPENEKDTEE